MPESSFFLDGPANDPAYTNLRDFDLYKSHKMFIENLWGKFQPLADPGFLEDAKTHFSERFWEMYLAYVLRSFDFDLRRVGDYGPDFYFELEDHKVFIEATVPGKGCGPDAVPDLKSISDFKREGIEPIAQDVPQGEIILRFTNRLEEKLGRYEEYIQKGLISGKDKCVIAINGREAMGYSYELGEIPYILKGVFPIGDPYVAIDRNHGTITDSGHHHRLHIQKKSGAQIPTDFFLNPKSYLISGILYSNVDMVNHPSEVGSNFIYIHNPKAKNPLEKGIFKFGSEYWVEGEYLINQRHS